MFNRHNISGIFLIATFQFYLLLSISRTWAQLLHITITLSCGPNPAASGFALLLHTKQLLL